MRSEALERLRKALVAPAGPHLGDETLAEIWSIEATGEQPAEHYRAALEHLESCPDCAEAYSALARLWQATTEDMSQAAAQIQPLEVYAALLTDRLQAALGSVPGLVEVVRLVAAGLPLYFSQPPAAEPTIQPAWIEQIWQRAAAPKPELPPGFGAQISATIGQLGAALAVYLERQATQLWGKRLEASLVSAAAGSALRLQLPSHAGIAEEGVVWPPGKRWQILDRPVEVRGSDRITLVAEKVTALGCRLAVGWVAESAGEAGLADRRVTIRFGAVEKTASLDPTGVAEFEAVPIAALPQLHISLQFE
jgi:hypothetical protein